MNVLHFTVPGDPVAWSRVKGGRNPKTGARVSYNPKRMVRKENDIWIACRRAMIEQGFPKVTGAVALFVPVKFKRPKCGEGRRSRLPTCASCRSSS